MSSVVEKIETFYRQTDESVEDLIEGSDEHLDEILSILTPLKSLTTKFEAFNEYIYAEVNTLSDVDLKETVIPKLRLLDKTCLSLIGALRTNKIYGYLKQSFKEYSAQRELLRELIFDLSTIRVSDNTDLDEVMKSLNEL